MLDSILGAWGVLGSVLWGGSDAFYFVEKRSVALYWPSIAQREREYIPTIFASLVPPYGAGNAHPALPILDPQQGRD